MITIQTKEFKTFFQLSAGIKASALYPALGVVKMSVSEGVCTLTKTNMNSYVRHDFLITAPECCLLLDDKLIRAFIAQSGEEVVISFTDKKINIKGGTSVITFDSKPIDEFPQFPQRSHEPYLFSKEAVSALKIAKNYVMDAYGLFNYVHVKNNEIFASNGSYIYTKKISTALPGIVLSVEACNVLNEEDYTYYKAENYDFFITPSTCFGFIKSEFATPAYDSILANGDTSKFFSCQKTDLLKFCDLVNASAKEEMPLSKIFPGQLLYDEHSFNTKIDCEFKTEGNEDPVEFKFNTKNMSRFISALPYDTLNFSQAGPHYKIWTCEDDGYTGIISGLK
jgi:hypothetical protein